MRQPLTPPARFAPREACNYLLVAHLTPPFLSPQPSYDGTLAHTSFSDHTPTGWRFLFDEQEQTAVLSRLVATGYRLVIFTNESPIGQAVKFETRQKAM